MIKYIERDNGNRCFNRNGDICIYINSFDKLNNCLNTDCKNTFPVEIKEELKPNVNRGYKKGV
jgi:hypothetical protein